MKHSRRGFLGTLAAIAAAPAALLGGDERRHPVDASSDPPVETGDPLHFDDDSFVARCRVGFICEKHGVQVLHQLPGWWSATVRTTGRGYYHVSMDLGTATEDLIEVCGVEVKWAEGSFLSGFTQELDLTVRRNISKGEDVHLDFDTQIH